MTDALACFRVFLLRLQLTFDTTQTRQAQYFIMAQTSLLGWANSIRLTMASDPGRKFFQEQVQIHGFSFLDDYLDNILSGAKQECVRKFYFDQQLSKPKKSSY